MGQTNCLVPFVAWVPARHLARLRVVCEPAAVALQSERGVGGVGQFAKRLGVATSEEVECLDVRPGDLEGPDAVRRENGWFRWSLLSSLAIHHMDSDRADVPAHSLVDEVAGEVPVLTSSKISSNDEMIGSQAYTPLWGPSPYTSHGCEWLVEQNISAEHAHIVTVGTVGVYGCAVGAPNGNVSNTDRHPSTEKVVVDLRQNLQKPPVACLFGQHILLVQAKSMPIGHDTGKAVVVILESESQATDRLRPSVLYIDCRHDVMARGEGDFLDSTRPRTFSPRDHSELDLEILENLLRLFPLSRFSRLALATFLADLAPAVLFERAGIVFTTHSRRQGLIANDGVADVLRIRAGNHNVRLDRHPLVLVGNEPTHCQR